MTGRLISAAAALPPWGLVALTNVLNVTDAGLTILWIELGVAVEGNPVVNAIGFPAKVVGVAVGSVVVSLLRPRWLWVPIVALGLVNLYHLIAGPLVLLLGHTAG